MRGHVRCTATASFEIQVLSYKTLSLNLFLRHGTRLNPLSNITKAGFAFMFRPTLFRCQLDIQHRKARVLLLFGSTCKVPVQNYSGEDGVSCI